VLQVNPPVIAHTATIPEEQLIRRLQAKDAVALDYLYDHYSRALYGVIFRVLQQEDVAEEVLQDAFLRIWDKIGSYDAAKGRLFTWMLNISRNLAIDKTRSREMGKGRKTDDLNLLVHKVDRKTNIETEVETIGLTEVLRALPKEQQFVVEHLYLKGYTQAELAETYNIPLGTVKTRLRLAMMTLRTLLKEN
jgi:RNA polymerase sigma-70 factor (ECF subfamily)